MWWKTNIICGAMGFWQHHGVGMLCWMRDLVAANRETDWVEQRVIQKENQERPQGTPSFSRATVSRHSELYQIRLDQIIFMF